MTLRAMSVRSERSACCVVLTTNVHRNRRIVTILWPLVFPLYCLSLTTLLRLYGRSNSPAAAENLPSPSLNASIPQIVDARSEASVVFLQSYHRSLRIEGKASTKQEVAQNLNMIQFCR
ncbi:hypothetical protein MPTK1_4g20220 [Marchantia polymorpha subsp. ruderalis]|uniref:Uncharacterized protein n=2 Tax=Marchantia polymorpha TaxID=3197 RepID=A0AAF6BBW5_MARPO|nr:hypothetical protein MARPO_0116s0024 [Marchantia polymorpha]BBN09499.1 hypothetical protein Mp_4g20220 [Marchantia polymorpha subsp. ruderalis]|eukprot:PTQ31035.1 hypothetical protein MARPO_0116s0024 [Marchantia polymorpha]